MALFTKPHFPSVAEFEKTSKIKQRSFAQVVANRPVSLMHKTTTKTHVDDEHNLTVIKSNIWRNSRSPGAVLFDLSSVQKYPDQQHMKLLHEQHPKVYACRFYKDGSRKYLEAYIEESKNQHEIKENGIIYKEEKIKIIPCSATPDGIKVTRISLTDLPMYPKKKVLAGLTQSLKPYGKLVDIGINTEPTTGLFMGSGYAVLHNGTAVNESPEEEIDTTPYIPLAHTISWCESPSEAFHATWYNMPTWCRYCHAEGHSKIECSKSKARIVCYSCHGLGHRSFECPKLNIGAKKERKNPPKTSPKQHQDSQENKDKTKTSKTIGELELNSDDDSDDKSYANETSEDEESDSDDGSKMEEMEEMEGIDDLLADQKASLQHLMKSNQSQQPNDTPQQIPQQEQISMNSTNTTLDHNQQFVLNPNYPALENSPHITTSRRTSILTSNHQQPSSMEISGVGNQ